MFVKDILGRALECDCIGCSIASGAITPPGGIIAETENFILHQDPEIPIKAFMIIASKKHISSISQISLNEAMEMFDLIYRARIAMKSIDDMHEVTIIQEERSKHFHLWLFPRYDWMNELYKNSLSTVREVMIYSKNERMTEDNINDILTAVDLLKTIV